jgi:nucleotide-binding universal stress UspA family protein
MPQAIGLVTVKEMGLWGNLDWINRKESQMLPKINTILFATDLSDKLQKAFGFAAGLTEQFKAQLYVLHVLEPEISHPYLQMENFKASEEWKTIQKKREAHVAAFFEEKLKTLCEQMNSHIPTCTITDNQILLRKGVPFEEILKAADKIDCQLIVIGTHGYGMVQDALMGGTARRLVRRSSIPVLVVPNV